ncbi:MAG: FdhD protein [Motiliproteus sp.]|jgi:FdhD protein
MTRAELEDTGPDVDLPPPTSGSSVQRWQRGTLSRVQDCLAEEVPVALCYNGISHVVMMASPCDLEEFALGFSLSEGIIEQPQQLYSIEISPRAEGIEINLQVSARQEQLLKQRQRNLTGRTGCGLCGGDSLSTAIRPVKAVTDAPSLSDAAVQRAIAQLNAHQPLQALTGAVHGAAWCSLEGDILQLREDVGRHNALDKLIGALVAKQIDRTRGFLLMSSRASYELIHKAASVGIGNLVAVSAPTALAIRLAEQAGIQVLGFAREGRHVRYTTLT